MSTALTPAEKRVHDNKRSLRAMLEKGAREFAAVLPAHLTPERLIRVAMTACTVQPKLLDCTQESVALALLSASQCGLEPDGYHAHLVPYGKQCQFIPDFKGLIQLALENNVVIDAYAVYEKDEFYYQLGTSPEIHHVPSQDADRGALICAYAVAHFGANHVKFIVATRSDIDKRRDASKARGPDSPWVKWEAEMFIKTAVKMLAKFIPRSQRMRAALVHDDTAEMGLQQTPMTIDAVSARNLPTRISKTQATVKEMGAGDNGDEQLPDFNMDVFEQLVAAATSPNEVMEIFHNVVEPHKETMSNDDYTRACETCEVASSRLRSDE